MRPLPPPAIHWPWAISQAPNLHRPLGPCSEAHTDPGGSPQHTLTAQVTWKVTPGSHQANLCPEGQQQYRHWHRQLQGAQGA